MYSKNTADHVKGRNFEIEFRKIEDGYKTIWRPLKEDEEFFLKYGNSFTLCDKVERVVTKKDERVNCFRNCQIGLTLEGVNLKEGEITEIIATDL